MERLGVVPTFHKMVTCSAIVRAALLVPPTQLIRQISALWQVTGALPKPMCYFLVVRPSILLTVVLSPLINEAS